MAGVFTVSLDCELYWGVRDKRSLDEYRTKLLGDRAVIPRLLELFSKYEVHATWAHVGFLFFRDRDELLKNKPHLEPHYKNKRLSPYMSLSNIGADEQADPFHFAPTLIKQISEYPNQEIGSHTFSHYYCLEAGQNLDEFKADLKAALNAAALRGIELKSLVFPRNQFNENYLKVCKECGIESYRGNQDSWIYAAKNGDEETASRRALRLIDAYLNVAGTHCQSLEEIRSQKPRNIAASRFLRPYSRKLRLLEPLRLNRITTEIQKAATQDRLYHLWWHPHNFGLDTEQNLEFLRKILEHYKKMRERFGMTSLNMGELASI